MFLAPHRHLLAQVVLDLIRHILEERAGGPATTGARGHLRREAAQFERLQNLLGNEYFFGAVAVRQWRERGTNRIAYALLQEHGKRRRGGHDPFRSQTRFRQPKMQRMAALRS